MNAHAKSFKIAGDEFGGRIEEDLPVVPGCGSSAGGSHEDVANHRRAKPVSVEQIMPPPAPYRNKLYQQAYSWNFTAAERTQHLAVCREHPSLGG